MPIACYALTLPFVLIAMVSAMVEINHALDELDIERFMLWVGVATAISAIPMVL